MSANVQELINTWGERTADAREAGAEKVIIDTNSFAQLLKYFHESNAQVSEFKPKLDALSLTEDDSETLERARETIASAIDVATFTSPQDQDTLRRIGEFTTRFQNSGIAPVSEVIYDDDYYLEEEDEEYEYTDEPASSFREEGEQEEADTSYDSDPYGYDDGYDDEDDDKEDTPAPQAKKSWLDRLFS